MMLHTVQGGPKMAPFCMPYHIGEYINKILTNFQNYLTQSQEKTCDNTITKDPTKDKVKAYKNGANFLGHPV